MAEPLAPGAVVGILGGGQLGRMLALAAARLGLRCHVFDPAPDAPAAEVSAHHTCAAFDDAEALRAFGAAVDVVTYEFENIPTAALDLLEGLCAIRPGREALRVSQDRLTEKDWLTGLGLACAPYADVPDRAAFAAALKRVGAPAILKTRRFGYDGKGQMRVTSAEADLPDAPAILEGVVPFEAEISVIGARGPDGSVACFDPGRNVHEGGILRTTTVPAGLPGSVLTDAVIQTGRILNALDYVGVLGVEFFVVQGGLIVNEIAPRVHNSGHWTQDGCTICQFEQHVRAVAGWPLGDGARHSDMVMTNLIGDDVSRVPDLARDPACALHLYGKAEMRAGRKMGHVNRRVGG
ncbi:phosphoribosylaminoimidazole carboxylase, ATPase subunit [Oceaniovalibus guishaninsula JLT2003]|uniref:N5-carboxyaminoimidazole ribonucleotide synthase n=1 Tax=Oceaniovalibus guishaninsula JLT2003 TaxID=1231392 RepID=K2GNE8_9RHOB|nr:5-(carboxyamino)imidazole ribonucleotide synthase [Oceaniovalibus guishaninsula]EKE44136.1 phosphoribosylaminoimidazole carboxylase, ATPase subunit [Oceaniovalibus guishaninsula JLT2003]